MNEHDDIELPQQLIDELRRRDERVRMLTPQVDREIAHAAAAHFATRAQPAAVKSRFAFAGIAAAAAAVVLVFAVTLRVPQDVTTQPVAANASLATDYDASGAVDVLDAFALARASADASQISELMQRVVALDGGPQ